MDLTKEKNMIKYYKMQEATRLGVSANEALPFLNILVNNHILVDLEFERSGLLKKDHQFNNPILIEGDYTVNIFEKDGPEHKFVETFYQCYKTTDTTRED